MMILDYNIYIYIFGLMIDWAIVILYDYMSGQSDG